MHQRSSGSCPYNTGNSYTCRRRYTSNPWIKSYWLLPGTSSVRGITWGVKEETHAARWGLLRGYSGKATKWVDFVVTDSTRREPCHSLRVVRNSCGVKGNSRTYAPGIHSVTWGGSCAERLPQAPNSARGGR